MIPTFHVGTFHAAFNIDAAKIISYSHESPILPFLSSFINSLNYRGRFLTFDLDRSSPLAGDRAGLFEGVVHQWDGLEEKLRRDFPELGFSIYGIIDRIAEDADGKGILFDYKKGRRFSSSDRERKGLQFYIYRLLAETGSPVYPERAFFITLRDCAFSEVSLDADDGIILKRLSSDAEGIKNGFWKAVSSDENCQGCQYRGICRRRFSIR